MNGLDAEYLNDKWRKRLQDPTHDNLRLRMRRATSWLQRAEEEAAKPEPDGDAAFVFYWIAFNAAYAEDRPETYDYPERSAFRDFFARIAPLDHDNAIYDAIWTRFSGTIRVFLENRYVYRPFWTSRSPGGDGGDWERQFDSSRDRMRRALGSRNTQVILNELFDRLYVLRNQIIHGGATWSSSVNRNQVRDGEQIVAFTVPRFINIMIDNPDENWGIPHYPPV